MKVRHIAVVVPEPEEAAIFYTEVLGFKRLGERKTGSFPGRAVDLTDGDIHFSLVRPGSADERKPWSHGTFGTNHIGLKHEDFDGVKARLLERGYEIFGQKYSGEPSDEVLTFFKFRDPVGMEVDLMRGGMEADAMRTDPIA